MIVWAVFKNNTKALRVENQPHLQFMCILNFQSLIYDQVIY